MPQETIDKFAETMREILLDWRGARSQEEKWIVESQLGEKVFRQVFEEDTAILGPWQLRTKGKRKEEKYAAFKARWDALCASDDLGISSKELLAWCRSVGLRRYLSDKGIGSDRLSWPELLEIQRLKSINQMLDKARVVEKERMKGEADQGAIPGSSCSQDELPTAPAQEESEAHHAASEERYGSTPSIAKLERVLEQPALLLTNLEFVHFMADPLNFKGLNAADREQLLSRVEMMVREMESYARGYRDFEAVLRWSRRM